MHFLHFQLKQKKLQKSLVSDLPVIEKTFFIGERVNILKTQDWLVYSSAACYFDFNLRFLFPCLRFPNTYSSRPPLFGLCLQNL